MKKNSLAKRALRIRKKLKKVNTDRFRLSVSRSAKNISAQIIDDKNNNTLVSATSVSKKKLNKKKNGFVYFYCGNSSKKGFGKENNKSILWQRKT